MGVEVVDSITHGSPIDSESEDEVDEPTCPLGGHEPPQLPSPALPPQIQGSQNTLVSGAQLPTAHASLSDSEDEVPTLDPIQRRQLKRAEQRRYSLRTREREGGHRPP